MPFCIKACNCIEYRGITEILNPRHLITPPQNIAHAAGTSTVWHEPGGTPGEAVFLPTPGGSSEDEGVLLAPLMRPDGGSTLVVLDARSMSEVCRAQLPFTVPYRFHGTFLPE